MKLASLVVLLLLSFAAFAVENAPPPHRVAGIDLQELEQSSTADRADLVQPRAIDRTPWHSAAVFYAFGLVGMAGHYTKKWGRGQYAGSLWAYLFADNPRASLAALLTYSAAAAGVIATGSIDGMTLAQVAAVGFTTGYVSDSAVNAT